MTIIELVTNLYFLYSIIWVLLGLWIVERKKFKHDISKLYTVIFSPIVFLYLVVVKIFNI